MKKKNNNFKSRNAFSLYSLPILRLPPAIIARHFNKLTDLSAPRTLNAVPLIQEIPLEALQAESLAAIRAVIYYHSCLVSGRTRNTIRWGFQNCKLPRHTCWIRILNAN